MQGFEWTTGLTLTATVACIILAALGYLLAMVLQGRKNNLLEAQLQQATTERDAAHAENQKQNDEIKQLSTDLHHKELAESKLQTNLISARETEQRLNNEVTEHKAQLTALGKSLEESKNQNFTIGKQLESALTENRTLKEHIQDLNQRLASSESQTQKERDLVSELKAEIAEEGKKAKQAEASNTEAREQLKDARNKLAEQEARFTSLQERYQSLSNEHTELKTTLERKEEHFKEQMQQLSETKQSLTKEFENLANKIFDEKGKTFTTTSQSSIDTLLKPFREQIEGFQKRINEVHDASLQGNTNLNSEIRKVLEIGLQMSKEANSLTSALKGDSQQRGAWGEAQLRRTLEMSGLVEEAHYEVQSSFKDLEGKQKQTDYLIKLPDKKHIIIDSKVALNAYDRAVGAETPEEYQLAMAEHVKAVRKHIDDLASKDYTNLVGMHSPSFVLMFMPIEPAYIEALKSNKELFDYGYKKGIVLVSHTTLIPILRTVSNLWMIERSNAEAREISEKAGDIYNTVCTVAERLSKLGGTLSTASNHYNSTVKALAGQQGLYGKVERFNTLSTKVSKNLPNIETSHIDFEYERLEMIVEAIDDEPAEVQAEPQQLENQIQDDAELASSELTED